MAKRYWNIVGYKKFDPIFDVTIPIGCLSDRQLKDLLRCLTAKADSSLKILLELTSGERRSSRTIS
jgi:hypothetical protein